MRLWRESKLERRALGGEVEPVLRHRRVALAAPAGAGVVDGLRELVRCARHHAAVEAAVQLELGRVIDGVAVRGFVDVAVRQQRFHGAGRNGIRNELLVEPRALGAQVTGGCEEGERQIALHGQVPGLRVAHAIVRVERVGAGGGHGGRLQEGGLRYSAGSRPNWRR